MERPSRPNAQSLNTIIYSDFLNTFESHPITHNLIRTVNKESVKQAIRNLLLTNSMERLYKPDMGPDIYKVLFENVLDDGEKSLLRDRISNNIKLYEPRVELINVELLTAIDIGKSTNINTGAILTERDFKNDSENTLMINVIFRIINTNEQLSLNVLLERSR